jgi:predicted phage-related endonuclease
MRIYHEKVGTADPVMIDNNFMFWGRENEDKIGEIWQYWDDTPFGYINNKKEHRIIRKCRKINGYVYNDKYPWLFGSLDRLINVEGGVNFITGETLKSECPLELKALSYWGASVWEGGIPQYFFSQVNQYMLLMEVDYAEIAILKDGKDFKVMYVHRDKALCDKILEDTHKFWYSRVVPAKEAKAKRDIAELSDDIMNAEKYDSYIQKLEPPPDDTEAYKDYMSQRFLKERESVMGTFELYDLAKRNEVLKKIEQYIKNLRALHRNVFINFLVRNRAELIDFGRDGSIRWYEKRGVESRVLTINIKEEPPAEVIESEFRKIDLNCY